MLIFKPDTVVKIAKKDPTVTVSPSGLISISQAAREFMGDQKQLYFVHLPQEKTSYLVASEDGFEFRINKDGKGLALNHSGLSRHVIKENGGGEKSVRFRLVNPIALEIDGSQEKQCYPLILLKQ